MENETRSRVKVVLSPVHLARECAAAHHTSATRLNFQVQSFYQEIRQAGSSELAVRAFCVVNHVVAQDAHKSVHVSAHTL